MEFVIIRQNNMNKETVLVAIIALLIGGIGGYSLADDNRFFGSCGGYDKKAEVNLPQGMHRMSDGSLMHNADTGMGGMGHMDHMMGMMVTSERAFIEEMIPHHQEAVDTAKEVIARGGTTPEIRQLVEAIVTAQEKEIADMKTWYESWYGESYTATGTYVPMMRELESLSGATLDRVFLEDMIEHHRGAIMMARSVQPYVTHDEIANLTKAIVDTQAAEIMQMRQYLQTLP